MIHITQEAWQYIRAAVMFRPNKEVAGFGRVHLDEDRLLVDAILVPPQEIGAAHAELEVARGDLDWLWSQIMQRGDQVNQWRFWWHSHASMGTSPSGTDHNTLKMLATQFGGWACGAVFNNKLEATGWAVAPDGLFPTQQKEYTGLSVVIHPYTDDTIAAVVTGWMEHVKEPPPPPVKTWIPKGEGPRPSYSRSFGQEWEDYDPYQGHYVRPAPATPDVAGAFSNGKREPLTLSDEIKKDPKQVKRLLNLLRKAQHKGWYALSSDEFALIVRSGIIDDVEAGHLAAERGKRGRGRGSSTAALPVRSTP